MAALSSSSFLAPVARRLPTHKVSSARAPASTSRGPVLIPRAIYTESARVPGMDPEDRRRRETERVLERTQEIHTLDELSAAFSLAGDKLVMVAVESDEECTMADDAWSQDSMAGANLESCKQLSASLSRIAREADEVAFLRIQVTESGAARDLAHGLGVYRFPTYQYYKHGELLWSHVGAGAGASAALSEGVLYYGGQGAGGLHVSDYITECKSFAELDAFIMSCAPPQRYHDGFEGELSVDCDKQLAIVDIGVDKDAPAGCLHIFPAALSLARNTTGFTRWARVAVDANDECKEIAKHFGVTQVPAFVFLANGKVVDKYMGADRLELMNRVLKFQKENGIVLPQKQVTKRMSTAEAKEIARAARERAKAQGRKSGW